MKFVKCRYCGRGIPEDSRLCPYCGKHFNELQDFVESQKMKREKIMGISALNKEALKRAFKPIELQLSKTDPSEYSFKKVRRKLKLGIKPRILMYIVGFSMIITLILIIVFAFNYF